MLSEKRKRSDKAVFPVFRNGEVEFTVWASKARKVELVTWGSEGEKRHEMTPEWFGYWACTVKDLPVGTRYAYLLDEKERYPDPASLSQPEGVHDPSELVDLMAYEWHDNNWNNIPLNEMILYELHTGTFTTSGDFSGIEEKLDYLIDLGVNTIEILPVAQFSGHRNWGYDGVYPFAVHNTYGGAFELMKLVDTCHQKGVAVILDVVYNHLGPEGNYLPNFGHYFTETYSTPWGHPINFDGPHSDEVRNYFVQNALMWLRDFHFDGLRLDAVHAIFDFSAKHIMREMAESVEELTNTTGKPYYLIAESHLNDVKFVNPVSQGGYALHSQWSDDFHHALHVLATGEKNGYYMDFGAPEQLAKAIQKGFVFDGQYSEFRKKSYGTPTDNSRGEQFVIFNQNHDQVGNRKNGDRLISLTGFEMAKAIAGTMLVTPNVPMLFMGEEYGEQNPFYYFVSHLDEGLNKLVREGRQNEFKALYDDMNLAPDPASSDTFDKSKLSWSIDEDPWKKAMFNFYKSLISLRKRHPALRFTDKNNTRVNSFGKVFVINRTTDEYKMVAIINMGSQEQKIEIELEDSCVLNKVLDSRDEAWNGVGQNSPGEIVHGQSIVIKEKSILIYTN